MDMQAVLALCYRTLSLTSADTAAVFAWDGKYSLVLPNSCIQVGRGYGLL